jgi:hypothetical protein
MGTGKTGISQPQMDTDGHGSGRILQETEVTETEEPLSFNHRCTPMDTDEQTPATTNGHQLTRIWREIFIPQGGTNKENEDEREGRT